MVNTQKIKGIMREKSLTQADVANALKISQPTANQKINNIRPMKLSEAERLATLLEIEPRDFGTYFFAQ